MYGNVYDLTIALSQDGADGTTRRVRVLFGSLTTASISRYWDGLGLVDDQLTVLRHLPGSPVTTLAEVELTRAAPTRVVRFRAMVPGLTSIPQALWLESRLIRSMVVVQTLRPAGLWKKERSTGIIHNTI